MAFGSYSGGLLLLLVTSALCDQNQTPGNVPLVEADFETECRDRYFFVSVKMPPDGDLRFEAIDAGGVHLITPQYGALCGYIVQAVLDRAVLRASYFSCHTDNQNDETFSLKFKLIVVDYDGKETSVIISKSCSVSLPWSPREVLCEENYMEVSVNRDLSCPYTGTLENDLAVGSAVSNWQVVFEREGQRPLVMSTERAADLGYRLMATAGRIVFRTNFSQPHTSVKMVGGVAVYEMHPMVIFRQNETIRKMDLDASCALSEGSSSGSGPHWKTSVMIPQFSGKNLNTIGADGLFLNKTTIDQDDAIRKDAGTVESGIPYVPGLGFGKKLVKDPRYSENSFLGSVVRAGSCATPWALQLLTINQTIPEDHGFTIYLGNVPLDVELVAVELNGNHFPVLAAVQSEYISVITYPNDTHAYIIKIPFEDQTVSKLYLAERMLQYSLEIKYTLRRKMSLEEPYYHLVSVVSYVKDVSPPTFVGQCKENGTSFSLEHSTFDYMWEFVVGPFPLTQQLADSRGYIMTNDSRMLIMHIPLFTVGYMYENVTLQYFIGTFEIITRNAKTLQIAQATVQHCPFKTTELLVCSADGVMTVVRNITKAFPSAVPAKTTLLDRSCKPREFDETRVLFSFKLNTCGTRVKFDERFLMYENELLIQLSNSSENKPVITRDVEYKITVRCVYSVRGTSRLFVNRRLRAETPVTAPTGQKAQAPMKDEVLRLEPSMKLVYPTKTTVSENPVHGGSVKYVCVSSRGLKNAKGSRLFQAANRGA